MDVSAPNNVKIYNLSAGKSLPDWLSDRKKRALQKNDSSVRRRIELIQDFEMPTVSSCIKVSKDGGFILATGTYKPRVRCYDVQNLSMKFERCFDSEVVQFDILSEDYSKLIFLQCDRYVELHAQYGRYYRLRIPKFGRDMAYLKSSCDVYIVGASSEVYRINLDIGRFLNPLVTDSSSINTCKINPCHQLLVCGTAEGKVEAWDPRSRNRVGILDCAFNSVREDTEVHGMPSVSSLCFKDGLNMAVGTATGQILLYDIRSDKPFLVKDHMYGLPIKDIEFHPVTNVIASMDSKIVKLWDHHTGKPFTSIEPSVDLNDLCLVPNTGMLFIANEEKKILTYYIPGLGPAPRWCSFLDNLTEELEENTTDTVYEDYKFVTKKELEDLGLSHLIGSNLLRAYMHGYFLDIRLYHKAKAIVEPFAFDEYRKKKIREKLEEQRSSRVLLHKLPNVNKDLAHKLIIEEESGNQKQKKKAQSLLKDDRFKALFSNPDFQVDQQADEFRLINPLISKLDKARQKELKKHELMARQFEEVGEEELEGRPSSEEDSSSDDERAWTEQVKKQYRLLRHEAKLKQRDEDAAAELRPKFYALKSGEEFTGMNQPLKKKHSKLSLGDRLAKEGSSSDIIRESSTSVGNREITFKLKKTKNAERQRQATKKHIEERRKIGRSAQSIQGKLPPKFWMGKRVQ